MTDHNEIERLRHENAELQRERQACAGRPVTYHQSSEPEEGRTVAMSIDDLLSLREACKLAKKHCGTVGLRYSDAQIAVEKLIHKAYARGDRLHYDDDASRAELAQFLEEQPENPWPP